MQKKKTEVENLSCQGPVNYSNHTDKNQNDNV
jgi:hypothetical protein